MTHWHEFNPWQERVVYVPLDELAEALYPILPAELTLAEWRQHGDRLDGYLLRGSDGYHAGIRFGPEGREYLSPYVRHPDRIEELYERHSTPFFAP